MKSEREIRIGWNFVNLWDGLAGIGIYEIELARHLLARLPPNWRVFLYTSSWGLETLRTAGVDLSRVEIRTTRARPQSGLSRLRAQQVWLPREARKDSLHILHSFDYVVPWSLQGANVNIGTFHDVIYRDVANSYSARQRLFKRLSFRLSAKRGSRFIAVSKATADRVVSIFPAIDGKIEVIRNGVRALPVVRRPDAGVFLAVGTPLPHKNYATLIRALPAVPGANVVIVGRSTPHVEELQALAEATDVATRIKFVLDADDQALTNWYGCATALVFPSLSEGFGLPAVEAMAAGVPVICSDLPIFHEICGEAGLFFDPMDSMDLARKMRELQQTSGTRSRLIASGLQRARSFSWARAADAIVDLYSRVIA